MTTESLAQRGDCLISQKHFYISVQQQVNKLKEANLHVLQRCGHQRQTETNEFLSCLETHLARQLACIEQDITALLLDIDCLPSSPFRKQLVAFVTMQN